MTKVNDETAFELHKASEAARDLVNSISGSDDLISDMVEGETTLYEAIEAALSEIDECDIISKGCSAKIDELQSRKSRAEVRSDRIRGMIEQALYISGVKTAKLPAATVSLRDTPAKRIISDESLIPSKYWKPQPPKLDKKALNADAKEHEIEGMTMSNGGISLTIRRA